MTRKTLQLHRTGAAVIMCFVVLHLGSHLFAWGGIAAHSRALETVRVIYRNPIAETILILAIILQISAGLRLAFSRRDHGQSTFWSRLQVSSGVVLSIFLLAHVSAALMARWVAGIDTNFYWPAGTLVLSPIKYWFWPYYMIAVLALFAHVASALYFSGRTRSAKWILASGAVLGPIIVLPFSGAIYPINLPDEHQSYFSAFPGVSP